MLALSPHSASQGQTGCKHFRQPSLPVKSMLRHEHHAECETHARQRQRLLPESTSPLSVRHAAQLSAPPRAKRLLRRHEQGHGGGLHFQACRAMRLRAATTKEPPPVGQSSWCSFSVLSARAPRTRPQLLDSPWGAKPASKGQSLSVACEGFVEKKMTEYLSPPVCPRTQCTKRPSMRAMRLCVLTT